ncbi:MAG: FAD:protein FMN transferase [Gammaproteobacteria bacterium]|nr:FAD:protein FMN transferase [Gammaproteobacteria bacterium]
MASPCEILIDTDNENLANKITKIAAEEAWRIEKKFSRYRDDSVVSDINRSNGQSIEVDDETGRLIDFADHCYQLSDGLFDITSGLLRTIWIFDGKHAPPTQKQAKELLENIGWDKITWNSPTIMLPKKMEIDLGGIGKEYAVDCSAKLISEQFDAPVLVNFGGDLFANKPPRQQTSWHVGIEMLPQASDLTRLELKQGALTTSGDARRFIDYQGKRYSHVLNPHTGWPVSQAPRSVTVAGNTCIEAGFISTMAMLKGKDAETFLAEQAVKHWVQH